MTEQMSEHETKAEPEGAVPEADREDLVNRFLDLTYRFILAQRAERREAWAKGEL